MVIVLLSVIDLVVFGLEEVYEVRALCIVQKFQCLLRMPRFLLID